MDIQFWANLSAVIGVPLAIIGLIIAYKALRRQIMKSETKIDTVNNTVNKILQNIQIQQSNIYINTDKTDGLRISK